MATRSKRKAGQEEHEDTEINNITLDNLMVKNEDEDSEDDSESEESYYSGLEEEEEESDDVTSDDEGSLDEVDEDDSSEKSDDEDSSEDDDEDGQEIGIESRSRERKETEDEADNKEKEEIDEYAYDSSDEEDIRNTVGNVPMQWYNDYPHIGYDLEGKKILQPAKGDELDDFLNKMENPEYWKTVKDKSTGKNVVLTDEEIDIIERIEKGKYPDKHYNPYEPYVDFFTNETMIHPVTRRPMDKRSFIPSLIEKEKVSRLVHAIRMGWLKPSKKEEKPEFYLLWGSDDQTSISKRANMHIPAPKTKLPGHEESYNPPPEYLPTEEEMLAWKEQDPEDRKLSVLPKKYDCLRRVPAYSNYIREQFERCLDLYLCPRQRKMRVQVNPDDLIPKLPKPMELQPFPTTQALVYKGHENLVRTISVDPTGQWLASGSDDNSVKLWEVISGRCLKTIAMSSPVECVAWCPNPTLTLLAVVVENTVQIINTQLGDKVLVAATDNVINNYEPPEESNAKKFVEWEALEGDQLDAGFRLIVRHQKSVKQVCWHGRGDYLATVQPLGGSAQVLIHQLSTRRTQNPFRKPKGLVQCVLFHPTRPFFFVATQRFVRVYNLLKQELMKKLLTNAKWVSSMAIHPGGDNLIVGSYDARLSWFDMDLSTKPYQTLRHHRKAIRQVCYHRCYPLFASASDDGTVIVCHGMVYSDLLQNPLLVPVKILKGHEVRRDLGVLDCQFHPSQPWLFSSAADNTIRLFT